MRNRLLAAFLAIAFAIIVIQDVPLATYLQRVERDSVMLSLERDAWTIANSAEPLIARGDLTQLAQLAHAFAVRSSSRVDIVDGAGTVVATTSGDELGYDYSNRVEIKTALTGMAVVGERNSAALGGRMLYVAVPLRSGATPTDRKSTRLNSSH